MFDPAIFDPVIFDTGAVAAVPAVGFVTEPIVIGTSFAPVGAGIQPVFAADSPASNSAFAPEVPPQGGGFSQE